MRISFRRTDGAYLFQHIKTKRMHWSHTRLEGYVLLSLREPVDVREKLTYIKPLIAEMLEHGNLPEHIDDVEVVDTEAIVFQNHNQ